jgi:hypothetical protein
MTVRRWSSLLAVAASCACVSLDQHTVLLVSAPDAPIDEFERQVQILFET